MSKPMMKASELIEKVVSMAEEKLAPKVRELVAESVEERRKEWEAEDASKATNIMERIARTMGKGATPERKLKGTMVGRFVGSLAYGAGNLEKAARYAETRLNDEELGATIKALQASSDEDGGVLVPEVVADEIIELLRPASVVGRFNPISVPLEGSKFTMPKWTSGSEGGWIGEGEDAPVTGPKTGNVSLVPHKRAAIVPVSNDLIRRAPQNVEAAVRDDLTGSTQVALDTAWLRGDGTGGQPKGLLYQTGVQKFNANGTVNLANVTDDLGVAFQNLMDADVRMLRLGWVMAPRTWRYLFTVRDGNGNYAFKPEMERGTLFGQPFAVFSRIPTNLGGGGDDSELYLADFADVMIGDAVPVSIVASDVAAYQDGATVVAAFSRDQTVVRMIVETDLALRHAESVVVVEQVTWGA